MFAYIHKFVLDLRILVNDSWCVLTKCLAETVTPRLCFCRPETPETRIQNWPAELPISDLQVYILFLFKQAHNYTELIVHRAYSRFSVLVYCSFICCLVSVHVHRFPLEYC